VDREKKITEEKAKVIFNFPFTNKKLLFVYVLFMYLRMQVIMQKDYLLILYSILYMPKAKFILEFDNEADSKIVFNSIYPEINQKISKTNVTLTKSDHKLELIITSVDTSALRAACNSFLRWISTVIDVKKIV